MAENNEEKPKKKGGPGRPFQKGVCPNPGGRPKVLAEVRDLAREYTVVAIETLAKIAQFGKNEGAKVAASNSLLERGWGKAPITIDDDDEGYVIQVLKLSNANNPNPQ